MSKSSCRAGVEFVQTGSVPVIYKTALVLTTEQLHVGKRVQIVQWSCHACCPLYGLMVPWCELLNCCRPAHLVSTQVKTEQVEEAGQAEPVSSKCACTQRLWAGSSYLDLV